MFNFFRKKRLPFGCRLETNGKQWRFVMTDGYRSMAYNSKQRAISIALYLEKCEKARESSIWVKVDNND